MYSPVRFMQIGIAVYGHLFCRVMVRSGLWRLKSTPAWKFTLLLEQLGTPFVKLGPARRSSGAKPGRCGAGQVAASANMNRKPM